MQEKELTGDALLAHDADYVRGATAQVYYAYPSATLPRFLVPEHDTAGLVFVVRMMTADRGVLGSVIRALLSVPGVLWCVRTFFFVKTTILP